MSSVQPVMASDLNGVEIAPGDIITDELVGYIGYVKNLCTDLGTTRDSKEGHQDFLNFQNVIESARISTFEPHQIDETHKFDDFDLTGESAPIASYPLTSYAMLLGQTLLFANNGGFGFTPFDVSGDCNTVNGSYQMQGIGLNPYDLLGGSPLMTTADDIAFVV